MRNGNLENMGNIDFFRESLKNLRTTGTITRSSKFLCKEMIRYVNFDEAKVLVELGAGDGVVTKHILNRMAPDTMLLSFEVNAEFCKRLRAINDPRLIIIEDSAENLEKYLTEYHFKEVDAVISAIPFVSLPDELGLCIVGECERFLKIGGMFTQMHYSLLYKKLYQKIFGNVNVHFVPINIPPAFVLVSEKR
ncbi:MAG: phospholipid N-methyltransferase [Saprospiraceae bacterium]|jgi:phospholipid N-methyltransferase